MSFYLSVKMQPAIFRPNLLCGPSYQLQENGKLQDKLISKDEFERTFAFRFENGRTITETDVHNLIAGVRFIKLGKNTLLANATLQNGSTLIESYSCLNPADFNEEFAKQFCQQAIYVKVEFLLAFLLQCSKLEHMPRYKSADRTMYLPFP